MVGRHQGIRAEREYSIISAKTAAVGPWRAMHGATSMWYAWGLLPSAAAHRPAACSRVSKSCRLEVQQREAQALAKQLGQLHTETSRLNGLLAQAAGQRSALREDNTALEAKLTAELKVGG